MDEQRVADGHVRQQRIEQPHGRVAERRGDQRAVGEAAGSPQRARISSSTRVPPMPWTQPDRRRLLGVRPAAIASSIVCS